jgi:PAS domain S-box-containing protein
VKNYTTLLIVITLVLIGIFLSWYVDESYQQHVASQNALMQHSTRGAAAMIGLYIKQARRSIRLFTEEEAHIIHGLSRHPENEDMQSQFTQRVKRHFPDYFAYTITDGHGNVLMDDFEGKIGEQCQDDIHRFSVGQQQPVFIHPNPIGYHFDIMERWQSGAAGNGIFFLSINPAVLSRILANSQLHEHQLLLLHKERPGLIEVSAEGTRTDLQREPVLSPEELAGIGYSADVEGSLWTLADLPPPDLFSGYLNRLLRQAVSIFLVFLLFSGFMYLLIRRAESSRASAERAVRESRNQLEQRVAYRTRQLSATNTQLESEVRERHRAEQALKREITERRQTEDVLRTLHEIASAQQLPFADRVRALLETGSRQFNLPIGILSHIHGDTYEVVQAISPDDSIAPGSVFDLGNTYCRETIRAGGPVSLEHAGTSEWKTHPCYREFRLESYFGIPVTAGKEIYGTLNFSSLVPRDARFTATDVEILRLMAQWVGHEIYRQKTEQALREEKNRVQRYLDVAGVIILVIQADQRVGLINRRGCQLLGREERDLIGSNWFDTCIPESCREQLRNQFIGLTTGESPLMENHRNPVLTSSGEERLISWNNTLLYDDEGRVIATLSSGEDITEQTRAQEQLRQREEQLRLTLENAPIGIGTADLEGRMLTVNQAFCKILGYSAAELQQLSIEDITHPDDWDETWQQYQALVRGDSNNYELRKRYLRSDGAVITVQARAGLVRDANGKPLMVVGQVEDITERERAEKMFRLVIESSPNAIVMADAAGRIVLVNSQTENYFGYSREELLGQPIETLLPERLRELHPEYRKRFMEEHRARSMGVGRNLYGLRKDGSEFPIEVGLSPVETDQETLVLSAIVDITERIRVDQELQRVRAYLKNIIDSMPSVLVGVDEEGIITEWNQHAVHTTSVLPEQAIGRPFSTLFPELESQLDKMRKAVHTHTPLHTERLITEKDGETRYADVMVYPLLANDTSGAVIRIDDITSRVRIEQMMVQTEKMMSVGGLAAGMAHEINNPLSGVLQSSQNIQRRISAELEANRRLAESLGIDLQLVYRYLEERGILEFIESIRQAASRASRIVADMLAFSRSSTAEFQPVRIEEILETVIRLASSDYDLKKKYDFKQAEIVREFDPDLGPVICDRTEIEQVLLNLVKNAAQAMALGGCPAPHRITLRTRREGDFARIEVEDNGPGMEEDIRRRVFEPFFTTKTVGVGTGLGLSVSYFIITEQHNGTIEVTSTPGEGSCFVVRLPLRGSQQHIRTTGQQGDSGNIDIYSG